jgi:NADP-dependent 3-hydroxy acid dehydrogenase YdfG
LQSQQRRQAPTLALGARRIDKLHDIVEMIGRRAAVFQTDVTDPAQCSALVGEAMRVFGRVVVLVNNAGVGTAVPASRGARGGATRSANGIRELVWSCCNSTPTPLTQCNC